MKTERPSYVNGKKSSVVHERTKGLILSIPQFFNITVCMKRERKREREGEGREADTYLLPLSNILL